MDNAIVALPLLLAHIPPVGVDASVVVNPTHTFIVPVNVVGLAFTVTTAVLIQPVPSVYVIVDVPATEPVITPDEGRPIVALPLLLVQVPPAGVEFNVVVRPTHTFIVPVSVVGFELTVTVVVAIQPPLSVYVIVEVPAVLPVTMPVEPTPALPLLLLQVPPPPSVRAVVRPIHTVSVPVMVAGDVFTVTTTVLMQPVETV